MPKQIAKFFLFWLEPNAKDVSSISFCLSRDMKNVPETNLLDFILKAYKLFDGGADSFLSVPRSTLMKLSLRWCSLAVKRMSRLTSSTRFFAPAWSLLLVCCLMWCIRCFSLRPTPMGKSPLINLNSWWLCIATSLGKGLAIQYEGRGEKMVSELNDQGHLLNLVVKKRVNLCTKMSQIILVNFK